MRRFGILLFCIVIFVKCGHIIKSDIDTYLIKNTDIKYAMCKDNKKYIICKGKNEFNGKNHCYNNRKVDSNLESEKTSKQSPLKIYKVGLVKNIVIKKKIIEYWFDDFLAVKIKYKNKSRDYNIGDRVRIVGFEKDIDNFYIRNFNYGRYLKSKGCKQYINISYMDKISENAYYKVVGKIKNYIIKSNRMIYKKNSDILNAVLVADKTTLKDEDRYIFSDSGTSHVMAASGLHVSIICGIILLLIGKINSFTRLAYLFIFLIFYNSLVGGGPSIDRAITMTILSSLGFFLFRKTDLVNMLFIIASIMIFRNPYIIYNISFELSFFAMLSLVIFTKYIKKYILSDLIAGSVAACILTSPIILYNFETVSTMGILGNLLVIPIIGIIVCLDIVSLLTYYLKIPTYNVFAYINTSIINILMILLKRIGNYGVNNIDMKNVNVYKILLYYILIFSFVLYLDYYYINKNKYESEKYIKKM